MLFVFSDVEGVPRQFMVAGVLSVYEEILKILVVV